MKEKSARNSKGYAAVYTKEAWLNLKFQQGNVYFDSIFCFTIAYFGQYARNYMVSPKSFLPWYLIGLSKQNFRAMANNTLLLECRA